MGEYGAAYGMPSPLSWADGDEFRRDATVAWRQEWNRIRKGQRWPIGNVAIWRIFLLTHAHVRLYSRWSAGWSRDLRT